MNRFATFAATALAAAGIGLAPAPAAALEGNDLAKIIAGIAVAGIVAKAIDDRNDKKKSIRVDNAKEFGRFGPSNDRYRDGQRTIEGTIRPYRPDTGGHKGPKFGNNYKQLALPRQCLLTVDTDRGDRLAYGARCLNQSYKFANRLPNSCETAVRTPRGIRNVYGARCLARDGWRVAGR